MPGHSKTAGHPARPRYVGWKQAMKMCRLKNPLNKKNILTTDSTFLTGGIKNVH